MSSSLLNILLAVCFYALFLTVLLWQRSRIPPELGPHQ